MVAFAHVGGVIKCWFTFHLLFYFNQKLTVVNDPTLINGDLLYISDKHMACNDILRRTWNER